jgi:hypothetical protein
MEFVNTDDRSRGVRSAGEFCAVTGDLDRSLLYQRLETHEPPRPKI